MSIQTSNICRTAFIAHHRAIGTNYDTIWYKLRQKRGDFAEHSKRKEDSCKR